MSEWTHRGHWGYEYDSACPACAADRARRRVLRRHRRGPSRDQPEAPHAPDDALMAYLRELVSPCKWPTCSSRAVVELVDRWNGSLGSYCRRHGKEQLQFQQRRESKSP